MLCFMLNVCFSWGYAYHSRDWGSCSRLNEYVSPIILTYIAVFTSISNTLWTQAEIFLISESVQALPVVKTRVTGAYILYNEKKNSLKLKRPKC